MLKAIVVAAMLAGLVGGTATGCTKDKPKDSGQSTVKTTIGDGSWIVGDELAEGTWQSKEALGTKSKCGWFITPTPATASEANVDGTVTIVLKRPAAKSFTTSGCGEWRKIGD